MQQITFHGSEYHKFIDDYVILFKPIIHRLACVKPSDLARFRSTTFCTTIIVKQNERNLNRFSHPSPSLVE